MIVPDAIRRGSRDLARFVRAAALRLREDRCLQIAGSLTYTTLLALVPLITVALALVSAFPVFARWTGQIDDMLVRNVLPQAIGKVVATYLAQFAEKAAGLTAIGVVFLAGTALMLMLTIDGAFNQIFRVRRERPLLQRLLIYWAALTLGPVLVGLSISMTSYLVSASLGFARGLPYLGETVLRFAPVLFTSAALTLLYAIVPNRKVSLAHALAGGVVAGVLFELMKRGFAFYIASFPTYKLVYGTFAAIPIFLVWLYASWLVVLFGATLTAVLPGYRQFDERQRLPGRRFFEALEVLRSLVAAQREGRAMPLAALAAGARLSPESCETLLERAARLGWVTHTATGAWLLQRDAGGLTLADVHRAFVFDGEALAELRERSGAARLLEAQRAAQSAALEVPLTTFFAPPESNVTSLPARAEGR
jgi:membrane protein